jgi:hypothetical protein
MDGVAVIRGDGVVHQFLAALAARHTPNTHAANFTGIQCHVALQVKEKRDQTSSI